MAMFFKLTLQPAKYFRRVVSRQSSQTEFAQAVFSFSGSRPEVTAQMADLFFELVEHVARQSREALEEHRRVDTVQRAHDARHK